MAKRCINKGGACKVFICNAGDEDNPDKWHELIPESREPNGPSYTHEVQFKLTNKVPKEHSGNI